MVHAGLSPLQELLKARTTLQQASFFLSRSNNWSAALEDSMVTLDATEAFNWVPSGTTRVIRLSLSPLILTGRALQAMMETASTMK